MKIEKIKYEIKKIGKWNGIIKDNKMNKKQWTTPIKQPNSFRISFRRVLIIEFSKKYIHINIY